MPSNLTSDLHTDTLRTNGACLCGQITYEILGDPKFSALCHCDNCKRSSGSAFAWNHAFAAESVRLITGQHLLKTYEDTATKRGSRIQRKFCSNCGSPLIIIQPARPALIVINSGGVIGDVSEMWKPTMEVFCKNKAKWLPDMGNKCFVEVLTDPVVDAEH
ncbi:hypothetical protein BDW22DRAFT_1364580 [Trametopsis cervina]|nr:hypothetical protein BDW22DRAFT_1364580 [Trametopsis cervina]